MALMQNECALCSACKLLKNQREMRKTESVFPLALLAFSLVFCLVLVLCGFAFCFVLFCDLIAFWDAHTKAKFLAFMARTHARSRARSRSGSGSHAGMRCSDAQDARLRQTLHAQVKQQRCVSCCSCSCCPFVVVVVVVACCKCCMCGAGGGVAG